ncbi:hypothetical protein JNB91_29035 [Rhizobium wenxiniae]|uniref:hypothetical protein n=1 Tax=Rhizobium wenxiniae TaxID=1737357 RepID=UPI001C6DFF8A|nr:hypothetical protein [Rhizobium wenxiniae]MBW9091828.1 hypothetical protein [Rhizobium wenxiniae]
MTERKSADTPTGLTPSIDMPPEKQRKVLMGRGAVGFLEAFAVAAFALYIFIAVYGPVTGT